MTQALVLIVVFTSTIALLVGAYMFFNRRRLAVVEAARSRLSPSADPVVVAILKAEEQASQLPLLNRLLSGQHWSKVLSRQLRQAGTSLNAGAFVLIVLVTVALGALLGARLGPFGMLLGAVGAAFLPTAWLQFKQRKRQAQVEEQLPDAIDMLVSALKSGYSFHAATNFLSQELAPPLGPEFARVHDEQRLGMDARTALLNMQERMDSVDVRMFVTSLLIQRETGGNLSEVLSNAADTVRERLAIRGHLKTLTAEATYSARILAVLPVFVFFALSYIVPDFIKQFTASSIGPLMLTGAAVSVVIGYLVMMKIADVDF